MLINITIDVKNQRNVKYLHVRLRSHIYHNSSDS